MLSERMRDRGVCHRLLICILSTVSCSPCFTGCVSTICPGLTIGNVSKEDEDIATDGSIDPPSESAYPTRKEYLDALQKWAKEQGEAEHRSENIFVKNAKFFV